MFVDNIKVSYCFDNLVPNEEVEVQFIGRLYFETADTYYIQGDPAEFCINKMLLMVNGEPTNKEIFIDDDLFEEIYEDLLEKAYQEAYDSLES